MANEKRLIEVSDENIKAVLEKVPYYPDEIWKFTAMTKRFPTVDAVEVVHGHWCWEGRFKACSKCGSYVEFTETLGASHWKYCPYCGAKMDGEGVNEARNEARNET